MNTAEQIKKVYEEIGATGFSCWIAPSEDTPSLEAHQEELLTILTNFRDGKNLIDASHERL